MSEACGACICGKLNSSPLRETTLPYFDHRPMVDYQPGRFWSGDLKLYQHLWLLRAQQQKFRVQRETPETFCASESNS